GSTLISKDILDGCRLWRVECNACDMEMAYFPIGREHQHIVANMQITQAPEYCWIASWTIKVSVNDCTPSLPWTRTCIVPAYILPWTLRWCCHVASGQDSHWLNERIDAY